MYRQFLIQHPNNKTADWQTEEYYNVETLIHSCGDFSLREIMRPGELAFPVAAFEEDLVKDPFYPYYDNQTSV